MARSWSVLDYVLIWFGGFLGAGVLVAAGTIFGDDDLILLLGLAGQYLGQLGLFWLLRTVRGAPPVGFELRPADVLYVPLGLVLQIALAVLMLPVSMLLFPEGGPPQELVDLIAQVDSLQVAVGLALAGIILTPVTEELLYRGVLLRALEQRGRRFALVVSSLVFSAIHVSGLDMDRLWQSAVVVLPPLFLIGLILGWITQRSGRLGPAVFLHSGYNLLAVFVLLLPGEVLEQLG